MKPLENTLNHQPKLTFLNAILSFLIGVFPVGWLTWYYSLRQAIYQIREVDESEIIPMSEQLSDGLIYSVLFVVIFFTIALVMLATLIGYCVLWLMKASYYHFILEKKMTEKEKHILMLSDRLEKNKSLYNHYSPKIHHDVFSGNVVETVSDSTMDNLNYLKDEIINLTFELDFLKEWESLSYSQKITCYYKLSPKKKILLASSDYVVQSEILGFENLRNVVHTLMIEADLSEKELADKLGVTEDEILNLYKHGVIDNHLLNKVCLFFDIPKVKEFERYVNGK